MKKTLLIVALLILAIGALGVGVVAAQGGQPPVSGYGPGMMWDGDEGPLHDYMIKAMAEAVGLSETEFEARHDAGETFYQIALAEGFTTNEIPALMQDARAKALDAAAADGVISQEQAGWMNSRGFGRGGMTLAPGASAGVGGFGRYGGYGNGECPMYEDGQGTGAGFGPGMMRGWGRQ